MQGRNDKGLWLPKGDNTRKVRSLRATDSTWEALNKKAADNGMSAADFIEKLALGEASTSKDSTDIGKAIALLEEALFLPPNKGGAIKVRIREALGILKG
jgi:hypothetical protein